jgi:aerobic-type carbon monoxide dehydrogenase small subunit (CoxS/CutS family)
VRVNGRPVTHEVPDNRLLLDFLRYDLGLTGTKEACSVGVCGACTVLLDGQAISACLALAAFADGGAVTTIEGLSEDHQLHPLQQAFIDEGGFQCGVCTPGQVVAATALLRECPRPAPEQVRDWMMGNLCRCTGDSRPSSSASPSTVVTSRPATAPTGSRQALMSVPSTRMLHAPQTPTLQPSLVPVRPRSSRSTSRTGRAAAVTTSRSCPFTRRAIRSLSPTVRSSPVG